MSEWSETHIGPHATRRMLRRACRARGIDASTTDLYRVAGMRHRTDGIATLAVVTLHEVGRGRGRGQRDATVYGYGVGVRAVADEHNEHAAAHAAVKSAMECAATVIAHRCVARRRRAALDQRLEALATAGSVAGWMREALAASDRERQRP